MAYPVIGAYRLGSKWVTGARALFERWSGQPYTVFVTENTYGVMVVVDGESAELERELRRAIEHTSATGEEPVVVALDRREQVFPLAVVRDGYSYGVVVACTVERPEMVFRSETFNAVAVLVHYFTRTEQAVSVGGRSDDVSVADSLAEQFRSSPPVMPGIRVTLQRVVELFGAVEEPWIDVESHDPGPSALRIETLYDEEDPEDEARRVPNVILERWRAEARERSRAERQPRAVSDDGSGTYYRFQADGPEPFVVATVWVDGDDGSAIRDAVKELLSAHGYDSAFDGPEMRGSWWQRLFFRARDLSENPGFQRHAQEIDRRLSMEIVEWRAAQVDDLRSDSVTKLLVAIEKQDEAVVVCGSLLIVKHAGAVVVRTLDAVTAGRLERNGARVSEPAELLRLLAEIDAEEPGRPEAPRLSATAERLTEVEGE